MHGDTQSARHRELLERAYTWALGHGLSDMSLRPLAEAIGSSPRVLLFLFGTKDGLIRAVLRRARQDEVAFLDAVPTMGNRCPVHPWSGSGSGSPPPEHRRILNLGIEADGRSLTAPDGPRGDFATQTVEAWLALLRTPSMNAAGNRPSRVNDTLDRAVLRGLMLDLPVTGDHVRTTVALHAHLNRPLKDAGHDMPS